MFSPTSSEIVQNTGTMSVAASIAVQEWNKTLSDWEVSATKTAVHKVLGRDMVAARPRVSLTPLDGFWPSMGGPAVDANFPAAWPFRMEAELATTGSSLQVMSVATYANLLVQRPMVEVGARAVGQDIALLQTLAAVAALRCGISVSSGQSPIQVYAGAAYLLAFDAKSRNLYLKGASAVPMEHAWLMAFSGVLSEYGKRLDPRKLRQIADIGPLALSAGAMLRSGGAAQGLGRFQARQVVERVAEIFADGALAELPWVGECLVLEAAAPFPVEMGFLVITDLAMSEAITRCLPCPAPIFAQSMSREESLRSVPGATSASRYLSLGTGDGDQDALQALFSADTPTRAPSAAQSRAATPPLFGPTTRSPEVKPTKLLADTPAHAQIRRTHDAPLRAAAALSLSMANEPRLGAAARTDDLPSF